MPTLSTSAPWNSCGYGASFENLKDGVDGRIDLGVAVVEVRREADSGFRPPVYEDIAGQQVTAHLLRFRHVDGDSAASLLGISWSVDLPTLPVGEFDQASGLAFRFSANFLYTDILNDPEAWARGLDGRNVGGSIHKTEWRIGVTDRTGCEGEGIFVREPSGELRLQFLAEVGADVEIGDAGSTAQPLEHASAGEVGVQRLDVDGDGAQ